MLGEEAIRKFFGKIRRKEIVVFRSPLRRWIYSYSGRSFRRNTRRFDFRDKKILYRNADALPRRGKLRRGRDKQNNRDRKGAGKAAEQCPRNV